MTVAHERDARQDASPDFDPREFYTIKIPNIPGGGLNAGNSKDTNGGVKLDQVSKTSSENWQLFSQSGRFFIRNYDYGPRYQLGVTEEDRTSPRLYRTSGSKSQQWTLKQVNGGWEMGNELWGTGARYALPPSSSTPSMRLETDGSPWNITINFSAAVLQPIAGDWVNKVEGFEVPSSAASTPSTTSRTSLATNSVSPASSSSPPQVTGGGDREPSSTNDSPASSSSSPSLSSGAIAGIAIGGVAIISVIVLAVWFFLIKKRRKRNPYEMHGSGATEKYAHRVELPVPPAELPGREKDTRAYRAEI